VGFLSTPTLAQHQPLSLAWRTVALLACVASLNYADRTSLSSVFPLLQSDLGMTNVELASIGSYFLWAYAAASPLAGFFADRLSRSRVIVGSLFAWSLVTLWTGFAQSTGELLLSRVLLGFAECAYLPAAVALIADHHPASTRGRATAFHLCGLNAGLVGGGTLAGYLGESYGWRASLYVLGLLGIVLAIVCAFFLRDAESSDGRQTLQQNTLGVQLRQILGNRSYLFLAAQAALVAVGTWMFFNWMPLYFRETFNLSLAIAGFSGTATLQLSAVAGALIGGFVSDEAARKSADGRLRVMVFCYLLCAPLLLVFVTGAGMMAVSVSVVIFSLMRALAIANETPSLCDMMDAGNRSTAQALMNMLNTLAGGLGVLVAGVLKADWGLGGVFAGVSVLMIMAAGLTWAAMRSNPATKR
jgi:predicted MFS family arabinose efflux permease